MSKKQKYIVVRPGLCLSGVKQTPVGEVVELTEEQANNKIGKVQLLAEHKAESAGLDSLKAENNRLKAENEELKAQVGALMKELEAPAPKKAPAKKAAKKSSS